MADAPAASAAAHDYPTIDPTSFDVVLCGTGLPESVLAAACAAARKTVLHVDPNPFYGSLFSSLPLPSLPSFLSTDSSSPSSSSAAATSSDSYTAVDLQRRSLYSEIETSGTVPEPSRRFTVDLVGPRVLYCADEAVDLLLRSGGSHHVEFKSVEGGSLLYWEGGLYPVPDSRQAIFKDTTLKLKEKNLLFRFFKLVQSHIAASSSGNEVGEGDAFGKISEEDLDLPLIEFLKKQSLSPKMRAVVLYAIAMADYDQDGADFCEKLLTTREGIATIALYSSSIGRFANAEGAFIYPMYGHGELPQAFCRCAAVKGALYVLRMPVTALLMDEGGPTVIEGNREREQRASARGEQRSQGSALVAALPEASGGRRGGDGRGNGWPVRGGGRRRWRLGRGGTEEEAAASGADGRGGPQGRRRPEGGEEEGRGARAPGRGVEAHHGVRRGGGAAEWAGDGSRGRRGEVHDGGGLGRRGGSGAGWGGVRASGRCSRRKGSEARALEAARSGAAGVGGGSGFGGILTGA